MVSTWRRRSRGSSAGLSPSCTRAYFWVRAWREASFFWISARNSRPSASFMVQFRHQVKVYHAECFLDVVNDDGPAARRLRHEIPVRYVQRPPVCQMDAKGAERVRLSHCPQLLRRHEASPEMTRSADRS